MNNINFVYKLRVLIDIRNNIFNLKTLINKLKSLNRLSDF